MMQCPNPNCKNSHMSFMGTRGLTQIFKCGRCGCEVGQVPRNNQRTLKGTYASVGTLRTLDRKTRQ